MRGSRYIFKSEDYRDISAIKWIPEDDQEIVGAVQIIHGMAGHMERFEEFAQFLNKNGFVVIGNDHRGHGKSLESEGDTGFFAEKDGWEMVLKDVRKVTKQLKEQHRDLPIFLFAHSMGTFFARDYITRWGEDISGVILSATSHKSMALIKLLGVLVRIELFLRGLRHRSTFFNNLSFGSFNKPFEPGAPTSFEWISRDREIVDAYVKDPLCGFVCTSSFFRDLSYGLKKIYSPSSYSQTPKNLPIFLYSGEEDPLGGKKGQLVKDVLKKYKNAGIEDITMELNPGGRHESINEINRQEIFVKMLDWIKAHL